MYCLFIRKPIKTYNLTEIIHQLIIKYKERFVQKHTFSSVEKEALTVVDVVLEVFT